LTFGKTEKKEEKDRLKHGNLGTGKTRKKKRLTKEKSGAKSYGSIESLRGTQQMGTTGLG